MGWSCNVAAALTLDAIQAAQERAGERTSNGLRSPAGESIGFFESSRTEHADGAITGSVWRYLPDGAHIRRAGSFRIDGAGKVSRFPMVPAALLRQCEAAGAAEYARRHGAIGSNV